MKARPAGAVGRPVRVRVADLIPNANAETTGQVLATHLHRFTDPGMKDMLAF